MMLNERAIDTMSVATNVRLMCQSSAQHPKEAFNKADDKC